MSICYKDNTTLTKKMTKLRLNNQQNSNNNARLPRIGIIRLGRRDAGGKATEVDHFLFDIQEQTIKDRIFEVYGQEPKSLDITFHTDDLDTVYTCEYQYWGYKQGKSYLKCSGDGMTAVEFGKKEVRSCSCRLMGNTCRQKTIIRFLIPKVTLGGTFLLVTKSQHSIIETTLKMAQRSGSLTKRKFKLLRTEGFATVNKFKVKKCFLALVLDEATGSATERSNCQSSEKKREENLPKEIETTITMTPISSIIAGGGLVLWDDATLVARQEEIRKEKGREKVLRKLKLIIKDHGAEAALKAYACERFARGSYKELTVQELLILWHDIDERRREVIKDIYNRILIKNYGLKLEPYKDLHQNIG